MQNKISRKTFLKTSLSVFWGYMLLPLKSLIDKKIIKKTSSKEARYYRRADHLAG